MITGKLYDWLKYLAQIALPAFGAFYVAIAALWGLPSAQEVAGTVLAVDTFLGVLLGISQVNYNKSDARFDGEINVAETAEKKQFSLDLKGDPEEELENKDELRFKVNRA